MEFLDDLPERREVGEEIKIGEGSSEIQITSYKYMSQDYKVMENIVNIL